MVRGALRIKHQPTSALVLLQKALLVFLLLFIFLVGIKGLGSGFKLLGKDILGSFFAATENPFVSLVVGILATTLVQSSSVTTSMIVALVAAPENPLPIANAIPMVMGANIGTTVTNTIASLAHMGRKHEFFNAFSVATCHDFFNWMAVFILLPLELAFGFLRHFSALVATSVGDISGVKYQSPLKDALKSVYAIMQWLVATLFENQIAQALIIILLSGVIIFSTLYMLVKLLRGLVKTKVQTYVTRALGGHVLVTMIVGAIVTISVQSSSITTSLLVPLAGAGLVTLRQAFPMTLGANVGTTITALLASLAVAGDNANAGVQIALVHLFFNVLGIALIYPIPIIRNIPLRASEYLAHTAIRSKQWAIFYVFGLFYLLPGFCVFVYKLLS